MKRNKLYIILLSGLLMASCSDGDESSSVSNGEDAFVTVSVAVDGIAGTKTTKSGTDTGTPVEEPEKDPGDADENAIKNLTVVFIDADKNEVAGQGFRKIEVNDEDTTARIGLKAGTYKMLVVANTEKSASFDPQTYYDQITRLAEQGGNKGFVMSNTIREIEIKAGVNKIEESVKRVVGRVDLSKVDVNWADDDLIDIDGLVVGKGGLEFRLSRVFLANVRPQSYLFDTNNWDWVGEGKHSMENKEGDYLCGVDDYYEGEGGEIVAGSTYVDYLEKDTAVAIKTGEVHTDIARFYAMTNLDTKINGIAPVILYIKGDLYDVVNKKTVLKDRHYRIKLEKGLQRNTVYKIEATIKGKGSPEAGDNKENVDLSVTIITETWDRVILEKVVINKEIEI